MAKRQDDCRRQQRADGAAEIATNLKQGLRHAIAPARGSAGNAGGFGMENRRADAHNRRRQQQHHQIACIGQQHKPCHAGNHAHGGRERARMPVGECADKRLEDRSRELECQLDQANLGKGQAKRAFQDRVDRRQQGLQQVVQQMRYADGGEYQRHRPRRGQRNESFGTCDGRIHGKARSGPNPDAMPRHK